MSFKKTKPNLSHEIVLGLVAPLGVNLSNVNKILEKIAGNYSYQPHQIKISDCFVTAQGAKFAKKLKGLEQDAKKYSLKNLKMDIGTKLCTTAKSKDFFAHFSVAQMARARKATKNRLNLYVIDQLKRPEEVQTLRRIYSSRFFLVGIHAPLSQRIRNLVADGMTESEARQLIAKDESEPGLFGQRNRNTFQLADIFVDELKLEQEISRFIEIVFGHPYHTPTMEEYAMFLAYASSFRSADLSRQVGAVLLSNEKEILAHGANDVPKFGGGLYWPGIEDRRDYKLGYDSNTAKKNQIIKDTISRIKGKGSKKVLEKNLEGALINDLTEFGRAVHAEMEAILSAARAGISPKGSTIFTTTFPCHNCAKHIVAAGIEKVIFIEPYPKSLAPSLHSDSIKIQDEDGQNTEGRVIFSPYLGVGPRRFIDLFSLHLSVGTQRVRKDDKTGKIRISYPTSSIFAVDFETLEAGEAVSAKIVRKVLGKKKRRRAAKKKSTSKQAA